MEMLIDGFGDETKKEYQDNDGMYLDVCEWLCIECDDDERVIEIDIRREGLSGSLQLCCVPSKANEVNITSWSKSKMTGYVELADLPHEMKSLSLENNQLTGEID